MRQTQSDLPKILVSSTAKTRDYQPIFRWAGSKKKSVNKLISLVPETYGTYIEPFFGSGCLFFALAPEKAILADNNPDLIETYKRIRWRPTSVYKKSQAYPTTPETYYAIRDTEYPSNCVITRAAQFLYLNRNCFNAIYRTNKSGKFNVPFGSRTGSLPNLSTFLNAAHLLKRAHLQCTDFEETLSLAEPGDFVYLDPPYATRTRNGRNEYGNRSFQPLDIPRLINSLNSLHRRKVHFLLSYAYSPEIKEAFPEINLNTINVRRHVAASPTMRMSAVEVLVSNADLFPEPK